ncbi:MAG: DUF4190 domain-containing protein [Acidobacteriota bacterium]
MKRCPTCYLTFEEDWLSFCTRDGTTLVDDAVSPSEPPPTTMAPAQPKAPAWNTPSAELPPSSPAWRPPQPAVPEWRPPPPPLYAQPQNKNLATASMILGIISVTVGWLCMGPLFAIAAIVLGAVALSQIKKTPERFGGKQMAWTGVVTGSLALLGIIIFYVFVLVVSNL